jgi:hypothetical protein
MALCSFIGISCKIKPAIVGREIIPRANALGWYIAALLRQKNEIWACVHQPDIIYK